MGKFSLDYGYKKRTGWRSFAIVALSFALLATGSLFALEFSSDPLVVTTQKQTVQKAVESESLESETTQQQVSTEALIWPTYGQAAYGTVKKGVLAQKGVGDQPVPIASISKVVTALALLQEKPLQPGEQGPLITMTQADVDSYEHYVSIGGSVVPVEPGMQLTQYQALQAMMLPSSNNMADTLTIWAFGSVENYTAYANAMLRGLGFEHTSVADASGFSPESVSTATEVVELGLLYLQDPVLREIALQKQAELPAVGTIINYNATINDGQILGIKVGFTDEAGKTFLAAHIPLDSRQGIAVATVLGADDWATLMHDTRTLLLSGDFEPL